MRWSAGQAEVVTRGVYPAVSYSDKLEKGPIVILLFRKCEVEEAKHRNASHGSKIEQLNMRIQLKKQEL
jgi:hypothetical protein